MRPRAQEAGLLVRSVGDQIVVSDQARQRLHVLNRTTALVWDLCDGNHTVAEMVEAVSRVLNAPANQGVVELALAQLDDAQLLQPGINPARPTDDLSRRQMLQRAAAVAVGVLLPSITSCGLPVAPDATANANASADIIANITTTIGTGPPTTTSTSGTGPPTTTSTSGTGPPTTTSTTSTTPLVTTTTTPLVTTTSTTTTTPAPRKVTMCVNGKTIKVAQDAVPGLLLAGATLGRCP